jgi:hypothetical protein
MRDNLHDAGRRWAAATAVLASAFVLGGPLGAATLRITSPAAGAVVPSGRTLVAEVEASGGAFRAVQLAGSATGNGIYTLFAPPYRFAIPIPPDADSRTYFLEAVGTTVAGEAVQSDEIKIAIERPDPPARIKSEASAVGFHYVGDQRNLSVTGTYADGSKVTLSYSSLTSYRSDNLSVATVDSMGLVIATGPGSARITIRNAGKSVVVPVEVANGEPLGRAEH